MGELFGSVWALLLVSVFLVYMIALPWIFWHWIRIPKNVTRIANALEDIARELRYRPASLPPENEVQASLRARESSPPQPPTTSPVRTDVRSGGQHVSNSMFGR